MKFLHALLAVISMTLASPLWAFIDPPWLEPNEPMAGEVVSLGVRAGRCVGFYDDPDQTDVTISGSVITIIIDGVRRTNPTFCPFPPIVYSYPIGAYPPGSYTLIAQFRYRNIFAQEIIETIGTLDFQVLPLPGVARPVPTLGRIAIILLSFGVLIFAARTRRFSGTSCVLITSSLIWACMISSSSAEAETYASPRLYILLASGTGLPNAEDVVEGWRTGKPVAEPNLSHGAPNLITYLLPLRAEGDFKNRLIAHPEIARAKLERYIIIRYPQLTDLSPIIAALNAEPAIETVTEPLPLSLSSVTLSHFSIETTLGLQDAGIQQYGWQPLT